MSYHVTSLIECRIFFSLYNVGTDTVTEFLTSKVGIDLDLEIFPRFVMESYDSMAKKIELCVGTYLIFN